MPAQLDLSLPGVYFLPPARAAGLGFPPLDVVAFVGFAERGPLHLPVPVEDLNEYRAVFGEELPLAQEPGGRTVYANLPRTVAGFFANGGRRCYVVRVAGKKAKPARFRIPGVIALGERGRVKVASIWASSAGRWSEGIRLGSRLRSTLLPASAFHLDPPRQLVWMTGSAPQAIQAGDVLRLSFADGQQWLFPVTGVHRPANATPATPLTLVAEYTWQLVFSVEASPPLAIERVRLLTLDGDEPLGGIHELLPAEEGRLALKLVGDEAGKVQGGDILRLELSDGSTLLFPITALRPVSDITSPPGALAVVALAEAGLRLLAQPLPLTSPPGSLSRVERLRFDVLLREGKQRRPTLNEMAFNAGHPRFWGEVAFVESSLLYRQSSADANGLRTARAARLFRQVRQMKRSEEAHDGSLDIAALGGMLAPLEEEEQGYTYVPLGMPLIVSDEEELSGPTESGSDDLAVFDPSVFVDDVAATESARTLMATAFNRYYLQDRRLYGLHSLLFVDEVALISVPDAAQREWAYEPVIGTIPEVASPPVPPAPDRSRFVECEQLPGAVVEHKGEEPHLLESPPRFPEPQLPTLKPLSEFTSAPLLAIHHALVDVCQARKDVVGILTLPQHFEKRQCIEWQEDLRQRLGLPRRRSVFDDVRDIADLSYVAVFHPWLLVADPSAPDRLRAVPCDGAVCGMIAARERERQVWVAPANVPLQGVLGFIPVFSPNDWADLFALQFNLIRPEPRDFRVMSAHTLSDERDWLQISVRRLLILLRKVAAGRGFDFVFESNHERFREGVRVMLEGMLQFMFERGAFSGAIPEQAFRVVTDARVNTPQDIEQGRFIAQIQVAPAQPLEFITVQLTRTGEGLLLATEV
jgi:hypothetical protein